jgi:hypothetical protein
MPRAFVVGFLVFTLLISATVVAAASGVVKNYRTHLTGQAEVPDPRPTLAQGQAILQVSQDGNALHYKLIVSNIENVVAAHIHLGAEGTNGMVVAFLYGPAAAGAGRTDGVLAEGTITSDDLVNTLQGQTVADLLAHIEAGNAYVNVHTNDGIAPTNTGPGDFPGGEVRGQIR